MALTGLEVERSVFGDDPSWGMIRLGPGYVFLSSGEALTGLEVERSVSDLGI